MDKTENKDHKKRSLIYTLLFMLAVIISLSFVKFSVLQITPPSVIVEPPLPEEIEEFVIQQDKASSGGSKAEQSDPAPNNNPTDPPLADDKPDETAVPQNPGFNGAGTGTYTGDIGDDDGGNGGGDGNGGDGNSGGGFGELTRLNAPKPPLQNLDVGGFFCIEYTVNDKGKIMFVKVLQSCTTISNEDVKKQLKEFFKRNTTFKAQPGAPLRKHIWQIPVEVG